MKTALPSPAELRTNAWSGAAGDGRGARLGVGSSLIYAPAFYAGTNELIELCKVAGEYQGMYISHMRSEGNKLTEAIDELIRIAREAKVPAEIYHLKTAGRDNWSKRPRAIQMIEDARAAGTRITADMYMYTAGSTGLNGAMPPWVQEGGLQQWIARMRDPRIRARVAAEMRTPSDEWENLLLAAGSPDRVLLLGFKNPAAEKPDRQDLGRGGGAPQNVRRRSGDGPGDRRRQPRRHGLFHDGRRRCEAQHRIAVGQLRLRCSFGGARGAVPAGQHASPHLRQRGPTVGQVCARRESDYARGSHPQAHLAAGREPGPARSRALEAEL